MIYLSISIAIFIMVLACFIRQYFIRKQHPPGPLGFPFVGQLPLQLIQIIFSAFLPKLSLQTYFKDMRERYGDIWSVDMGDRRMIVLASIDVITEAFADNAKLFSGRPVHESFTIIGDNKGILFNEYSTREGNRQLTTKALRDLGMGTQDLELKISNEVDDLIEYIEKNLSKPIISPEIFVKAVSNVTNLLSFDERSQYNDPELECFIENLNSLSHFSGAHNILELFGNRLDKKYLRRIFSSVDKYIKNNEECMRIISNKCRSRIRIEAEFAKPNCVFDYFWRYRYQDNPEMDPKEKFLDIAHSMFDIAFAGYDTSTNLLGYSCLILGQYPDIQKELRRDIQLLVDDHKFIKMEMRKDLPTVLSFIDEIHRHSHLVPLLYRRAIQTSMFKGYKIGPNDIVYGDQAYIMRDPLLYENPDDFNLYRFMDESRTKYVPNKFLIPFGIGKRACLGESIATMEMFLFLSKIIQRFNISLSNETKTNLPKIFEGTNGIVHAPLDHEITFELIH